MYNHLKFIYFNFSLAPEKFYIDCFKYDVSIFSDDKDDTKNKYFNWLMNNFYTITKYKAIFQFFNC